MYRMPLRPDRHRDSYDSESSKQVPSVLGDQAAYQRFYPRPSPTKRGCMKHRSAAGCEIQIGLASSMGRPGSSHPGRLVSRRGSCRAVAQLVSAMVTASGADRK
jgi:hypothetical protein